MTSTYKTKKNFYKNSGFTLLYALIISSLILATVLSIVNIALKQSNIAGLGRRSQVAFYAANSGMECALYWVLHGRPISTNIGDITTPLFKIPRSGSSFASQYDSPLLNTDDTLSGRTDTDNTLPNVTCFGQNIIRGGVAYSFDTQYVTKQDDSWFEAMSGEEISSITQRADLPELCGQGFLDQALDLNEDDYRVWLFRMVMPQSGKDLTQENPCAEVAVCRRVDSADLSISSRGYNTCDMNSPDVVERAVRLIQL